jgi:phosphopantetheine adenylyltransferase
MIKGFFDGLIISPESQKGADYLNNSRKEINESPIPVYIVALIGGKVAEDKFSSSFVRDYLIKKNELDED